MNLPYSAKLPRSCPNTGRGHLGEKTKMPLPPKMPIYIRRCPYFVLGNIGASWCSAEDAQPIKRAGEVARMTVTIRYPWLWLHRGQTVPAKDSQRPQEALQGTVQDRGAPLSSRKNRERHGLLKQSSNSSRGGGV